MSASDPTSGYSLIELVVALLLLSMVALAAQSGLHFGTQVWRSSEETLSGGHKIWTAQSVLRQVVSHALPRFKGEYVTFSGEPGFLAFDALPPEAFARFGVARVTLSLRRKSSGQSLEIAMEPLRNNAGKKTAILAEGLHDLSFTYLDENGPKGTWLSSWRDRSHLPVSVRITASDADDWPPMTIRLVVAETPTCTYDPDILSCRRP